MRQYLKIFIAGAVISFLGSLPLGTMNVAATQISIRDGAEAAFIFALGSMIIELIYVSLILKFMQWFAKSKAIFQWMSWVTVLILLLMAFACFRAGAQAESIGTALPPFSTYHFLYGCMLSAANPLHFIFWFGWSSFLFERGTLKPTGPHYRMYIPGLGIGTVAGFAVFIWGGHYLVDAIKRYEYVLNWFIGFILLATAIIQLVKIFRSVKNRYQL